MGMGSGGGGGHGMPYWAEAATGSAKAPRAKRALRIVTGT